MVRRNGRKVLTSRQISDDSVSVQYGRYEPATRDGEPIDVYFTVIVDYTLHE